jgi:hypothetical protein
MLGCLLDHSILGGTSMAFTHFHPKAVASLVLPLAFALASGQHAQAATVNWVTWTQEIPGEVPLIPGATPPGLYPCFNGCPNPGSAIGASSDVQVSYTGQMDTNGPFGRFAWTPVSTYTGGTVDNAPPDNTALLVSGLPKDQPGLTMSTITFSQPVNDPVIAIAELGYGPGSNGASGPGPVTQTFDFSSTKPLSPTGDPLFALEAGGPSIHVGGGPMTQVGDTVVGTNAAGVIQFFGTFSSISWIPLNYDYYTWVTVGDEGLADPTTPGVPEPSTWLLLLSGFAGLGFVGYRARRKAIAAAA